MQLNMKMKPLLRFAPLFVQLLILSTLMVQTTFAQGTDPQLDETPPQTSTEFKFSKKLKLGASLASYRYVEPGLIEHAGLLYGVNGEFNWDITNMITGVLQADLSAGKLNYDGALCDVDTTNGSKCTAYSSSTTDVILRLTHRFDFKLVDSVHFFLGPGIRYLYDKGDSSGFYTRIGMYLFAPIGFKFQVPIDDESGLSLDLEYDVFLGGTMESKLSEVNSKYGDMTHRQGAGSGHKVTLGYEFNKHTANPIQVAVYYENWNIAASNKEPLIISGSASTTIFSEPKNFSESLGLKGVMTF